jgi:methyl-accepting chemotaxis protein
MKEVDMTEATPAERWKAVFVTPEGLSREEQQRQSSVIRRMALAQMLALCAVVVAQLIVQVISERLGDPNALTWVGLGLLLAVCGGVMVLANWQRPVEGAWLLVLGTTTVIAVLGFFFDPGTWPSLPVILLLLPVVVAGTALLSKVFYAVAGVNAALFILLNLIQGRQIVDLPREPVTSPAFSNFLADQWIGLVVAFLFVAYVTRRNATSLRDAIQESEGRAQAMMETHETLMEKNIQQVELSTQLGNSAIDLSATSRQQASGSAEQASAITQVTSTIEEMGYTAKQIAQSAENVAGVAEQTLEAVGRGQAAVDESVSAMEGIKGRVQELADKVLALGERSQRIGEIIEIINDIADETHLLSLNAAIESAGAGEFGRRFAVVAAEIKNLANRAIESSKEVRGIIAEIQGATNASVMASEEGLKETERGVRRVYEAGRAIEQIVMLAQRTSESAQEISLATTQQRTASEQIVETMREIAEVANQTAEGSRQLADAAAMITAIAGRMQSSEQADA